MCLKKYTSEKQKNSLAKKTNRRQPKSTRFNKSFFVKTEMLPQFYTSKELFPEKSLPFNSIPFCDENSINILHHAVAFCSCQMTAKVLEIAKIITVNQRLTPVMMETSNCNPAARTQVTYQDTSCTAYR